MNRIWTVLGLALVVGVASYDVDAKRAGKGSSVGAQRSSAAAAAPKQTPPAAAPAPAGATPTQSAAAPAAAKAPAAAPAAPVAPPKSGLAKWGPMLGGLALGGLLGSMLGGGALGSIMGMLANVLLIGGLVFLGLMLWRKFKGGNASASSGGFQPAYAGAGAGTAQPVQRQSFDSPSFGGNPGAAQPASLPPVQAAPEPMDAAPNVPAGFDVAGFAQGAKGMFNRLQAAYDKGDAASLKDMSTDEMYAELDRELKASGPQKHATEVVTLNAEVIEVTTEGDTHWASVRFSGLIREDGREMAEPFDEIWNMSKPVSGAHGWLLAGIQQLS